MTNEQKKDMEKLARMVLDDNEDACRADKRVRETRFNTTSSMPPALKRHDAISPSHFENSEAADRLYGDLDGKKGYLYDRRNSNEQPKSRN